MRKVRPMIRALEISFSNLQGGEPPAWPRSFWDRCLANTPCEPVSLPQRPAPRTGTTLDQVRRTATALAEHSIATTTTTDVDARHDAVFGIAAFALNLLEELLRIGNGTGILGRAGLRTLLETLITLAYLAKVDDPKIWQAYRSYGAGQAKLAFLKLDELTEVATDDLPTSIDIELLRALANEDRWQEYTPINLGHWDGSNLRSLSESSGEKPAYDQFYGWTSSFVHSNWAAVRASAFDLCANPLHRFHRVLRDSGIQLGDVVTDASGLADRILDLVARMYPEFTTRVTIRGTEQ